jgi:hypothetical protein
MMHMFLVSKSAKGSWQGCRSVLHSSEMFRETQLTQRASWQAALPAMQGGNGPPGHGNLHAGQKEVASLPQLSFNVFYCDRA